MRRLAVLVGLGLLGSACSGGSWEGSLDDALKRQPAVLVEDPESVAIGDGLPDACGGPFISWLVAIDAGSGERLWQEQIPFASDPPLSIGDRVLTVGSQLDTHPPSVVAFDVRTGQPIWQRFFAHRYLYDARPAANGLSVSGGDDVYEIALDGSIIETRPRVPGDGDTAEALEWRAELAGDQLTVTGPDGLRFTTEELGVPQDFDVIERVEEADGRVLVEIGSEVGPNAHAVVVNLEGALVVDALSVRNARLAGDLLLYDVRNSEAASSGVPTRELYAVSLDSGDLVWQTQAFAEHVRGLPGFVGAMNGLPVFAVRTDESLIDIVVPESAEEVPVPVRPALTWFPDWLVAVDDDVVAVGTDLGVAMYRADDGDVWVPTELPVRSVVRSDDTILAITGSELVGCG
ncbi:MAG: PQQ-binding-like beta-propeller repeat protein [Acidimicrobiales bacterium]|nr:PQQ-binding-like beta-propeller repeat protein [Acidimicrobiales bacterium]